MQNKPYKIKMYIRLDMYDIDKKIPLEQRRAERHIMLFIEICNNEHGNRDYY